LVEEGNFVVGKQGEHSAAERKLELVEQLLERD